MTKLLYRTAEFELKFFRFLLWAKVENIAKVPEER